MPLCPQITITPVTVTSTGMTTSNTDGVYSLDTSSPAFTTVQTTANNAWSAALGKNTVFYQTTAPSTSGRVAGDVWFDTDDGNRMYGFNGTSWVAYQFGTASFLNSSVDLSKLADGSVSATKLIDGAVVAGKIAASAVGTNELAANSIVAGKIAASTITGDRIAAATITGTNIAAGTITASNIAAGTITSDRIAAGAITASMITSGTMSADRISGGTIASSDAIYSISIIGTSSISSLGTLSSTGALTVSGTATFNSSINVSGISAATGSRYLVQDVNGFMRQGASVSSQRYKHSIVPIGDVPEFNPTALLSLPVRAFKYNDDILGDDDSRYQTFIPGFVAEEVDAVYPIAVDYDREGRPDSVNAPYLIPGMLALIQQLAARVAVLEGN